MTNPIVIDHNVETGEVTEREMTSQELTIWDKEKKAAIAEQKRIEDQALLKQSILDRLGLTAEEAAILLK
jgi:hypothetical protein